MNIIVEFSRGSSKGQFRRSRNLPSQLITLTEPGSVRGHDVTLGHSVRSDAPKFTICTPLVRMTLLVHAFQIRSWAFDVPLQQLEASRYNRQGRIVSGFRSKCKTRTRNQLGMALHAWRGALSLVRTITGLSNASNVR